MIKHIPKKKFILFTGDILLVLFACLIAPSVRFLVFVFDPFLFWQEILVITFIYILCFYVADFYNFDSGFINTAFIYKYLFSIIIATSIILIIFFLIPKLEKSRGIFIINAILIGILIYAWRFLFERISKKFITTKKKVFLILGAGKAGNKIYDILKNNNSYRVAGFLDNDHKKIDHHNPIKHFENFNKLQEIVEKEQVDHIVLAMRDIKDTNLLKKILEFKLKGIKVYDVPSFYEEILGRIEVEYLDDLWILNMPIHGVKKTVYNRKIKRLISITVSLFLLIIALPIFLLTMIAIRLESKGPIFFRQKRVGLNGKVFEAIKFRTMRVGTENDREHAGKKDDPRITKIGHFLRKARIDEIPQLLNVLKGEMSLIGPRALMLEEVEEFEKKIPYFSVRHSIKPGVTGWAQVNYPHGATIKDAIEKLKYDLFYIKNLSPFLDFHIMLRTIRVVLFGRGAK